MANKYWVGGTGDLDGSTTTHISDSSGGAGGATYPASGDTLIFDGASGGGTVTFTVAVTLAAITMGAFTGTVDTNGQTVTVTSFSLTGTATRTLTLGASTINLSSWNASATTGLTFNSNTSTLNVAGNNNFIGGGLTYATVVFSGNSPTIFDGNTFGTLTRTGNAATTDSWTINANQTISGTLTINGNSPTNRVLVRSNTKGTARTITAATVSVTNADFQDITGAGAGSWDLSAISGGSGDAGGNSGITFTTADVNYWIGGTGSWSDSAHWSTSTGGAADGRVPLPQDSAVVDANSGTGTITQDMPRIGATDFTGSSGITWTTSTVASFFGSINLTGLGTLTANGQTYTYEGRGASTLTGAGKTWAKVFFVDAVTGSLTLGDAHSSTNGFDLTSGTFSDGGFSVGILYFESNGTPTRVLTMGSGNTWSIPRTGSNIWSVTSTGLTINPGTATIRLNGVLGSAGTFVGGDFTYYRLENATTGAFALNITGSNTFSNGIYIDASAAARTIQFTAGTTTTLGGVGLDRDAGSNIITLGSVTAATHTLTHPSGPVIALHDMDISYSVATQTDTFYAGATPPSNDGGNNTNWIFTDAPSGGGTGKLTLLGVG